MSTQTDVQEIYIGLLGRAADKAGYDYWVGEIEAGILTIEDVRANIVNEQPEYLNGIGMMTRSQGVTQLYINLFGRSPEEDGLEYWVNGDGASVNFDQLVLALIDGASAQDRLVLDNRDTVAINFTDSAYGSADPFDIESARIVQTVDETPESVAAANDAIENGSISTGETFVLTTAQDVIDGTSASDTIVGLYEDTTRTDTFTLGDQIDGGGGVDTLEIYLDDDDGLTMTGKTITNVENLVIFNADDDLDEVNIANTAFESVTLDLSAMDENFSEDVNINNINTDTALTVEGIQADANFNINADFVDSKADTGSTTVVLQDMDFNELDTDIEAAFTAATTHEFNLTATNIDSNDNFNVNANIDLDAMGVQLAVNVDLTDVVGEDVNMYLDFNTGGGVQATAVVDINDSNVNEFYLDIDDNNNGTSDMDMLTINLNGLNNEVSDENANAILSAEHFETVVMNVTKDAVFDYIDFYGQEGNDLDITIDVAAGATMTVESDFNINGNVGNELVTITGAGNIDLGAMDMDNDANSTHVIDASALTGNLTVSDGNLGTIDAITGGSGDDKIVLAGFETVVDAGAGDDFVDTSGNDFGDADAVKLDGGDGVDTIAINDGALLDSETAANISNFEVLDVSGGTGTYDLLEEPSLKDVSATGFISGLVTIDNVGSDVALTLNAFNDADLITMSQEDGDGTADALELNLNAVDQNKDQTADGQVNALVMAAEYEAVNLMSNASTASEDSAPGAGDALVPADYVNILNLDAADMTDLTIGGIAQADVTFTDATALVFVDASASAAGVAVDASTGAVASGVTFKGSDAVDTYVATAKGDLLQANGGADVITLGAGVDTARFVAATDSQLMLVDTDDPADDVADVMMGYDTIAAFTGGSDLIELSSSLGLAEGDARTEIMQKGGIGGAGAAAMQAFIGDGVDFFDTGVVERATAFADDGADGFLFVDANADGDFTQADDMVIQLTGVTTLAITDLQFG